VCVEVCVERERACRFGVAGWAYAHLNFASVSLVPPAAATSCRSNACHNNAGHNSSRLQVTTPQWFRTKATYFLKSHELVCIKGAPFVSIEKVEQLAAFLRQHTCSIGRIVHLAQKLLPIIIGLSQSSSRPF